jgi:hypothetical protein
VLCRKETNGCSILRIGMIRTLCTNSLLEESFSRRGRFFQVLITCRNAGTIKSTINAEQGGNTPSAHSVMTSPKSHGCGSGAVVRFICPEGPEPLVCLQLSHEFPVALMFRIARFKPPGVETSAAGLRTKFQRAEFYSSSMARDPPAIPTW